ncbi:TIGR00341 family protein [Algoriphagus halophytocola]|uniref:TIGR00341 family protein n=1 Tax=Algoriphagus halophytocola TaxID=2991499 RepID=A0ABY6MH12_9BACT|nr:MULTISPECIES: TIGR00341 family protein [unclassified Algoriphagus]UZD22483.1 TIGR00341 family protein [Algoriphagus sp. TR-M5]WBL43743.1 TIGR00341 family protein [Algoriphagus sp. TR-M9]
MESPEPRKKKNNQLLRFLIYIRDRFDLQEGKEDELDTIEYISKNVEFRGANLWILIFAIFVASVGLNVNSTAVVIGAMLISPLMGPIMGIGMAAGINDFELLKRSLRNLAVAVFIAILTSSIYFTFTPLDDAQSELLARTEPTIWDVLIALFGGLAGIIAGSRKEKSNAIPGVAIATALMPPLCTAGYGLATMNLYYFIGAFYLFFINSVFISLSTYLIVRFMKYPKKEFLDEKKEKRVQTYITVFTILTIVPSVYLAYGIVVRSIWEEQAKTFIQNEFVYPKTQVLNSEFFYSQDPKMIQVNLIGEVLPSSEIDKLREQAKVQGFENTELRINQSGSGQTDMNLLRSDILKDLYERNEKLIEDKDAKIALLEEEVANYGQVRLLGNEIAREAKINHPTLQKFTMNRSMVTDLENNTVDTLLVAYAEFNQKPTPSDTNKLLNWLKLRTKSDTVALILQ